MDPATGAYNRPFIDASLHLEPGYRREQGLVFRADNSRFEGSDAGELMARAAADPALLMVNRNAGGGARILTDRLLNGARPAGYDYQVKSHNVVAAAVAQGRADWGVGVANVARVYGLGFLPLQDEIYDFVIPAQRLTRPPVRRFLQLLADPRTRARLGELGFRQIE